MVSGDPVEGRRRIALLTGGTGGHIFPALAVAQAAREQGVEVLLGIGSPHLEREWPDAVVFSAPRLRPVVQAFRHAPNLLRLARTWQKKLRDVDAVVGFGSYASFPALLGALWARKVLFLHEQNALPGRVTRLLAPFARRIFLTFPGTLARYPRKGVWTGNPIRPELLAEKQSWTPETARRFYGLPSEGLVIGLLGGSQGARPLLEKVLPVLLQQEAVAVLVLTGEGHFSWAKEHFTHPRAVLVPFEDHMARFYQAVDGVISRAGGGSIAELVAFQVPTLFIPFPHAADNHQVANAREVVRMGAGEMLEEHELHPGKIRAWVRRLQDPEYRKHLVEGMRRLARPRAAWEIVEKVLEELDTPS